MSDLRCVDCGELVEIEGGQPVHRGHGEARGALALYDEDGFLDNNDLQRVMPLVRWALSVIGEQAEPDYEAAAKRIAKEYPSLPKREHEILTFAKVVVDAAVGGRLLVDPPKEEERDENV